MQVHTALLLTIELIADFFHLTDNNIHLFTVAALHDGFVYNLAIFEENNAVSVSRNAWIMGH